MHSASTLLVTNKMFCRHSLSLYAVVCLMLTLNVCTTYHVYLSSFGNKSGQKVFMTHTQTSHLQNLILANMYSVWELGNESMATVFFQVGRLRLPNALPTFYHVINVIFTINLSRSEKTIFDNEIFEKRGLYKSRRTLFTYMTRVSLNV